MRELAPFSGIRVPDRLRREFDDVWSRFFTDLDLPAVRFTDGDFVPRINVRETDDALVVTVEVPGMKPEEIEVTLTGDILSIKGEKREEKEEKKSNYHLVERRFGSFNRTFRLPVEVKTDKLSASHKDGVLTVTLPKAAKATAKTIKVRAE
jgi:HSP20 family protein